MIKRNPIISALKDILYFGLETFGRYYSTYRGFVASNDDPKNLQRIQLIVPELTGNAAYQYWAFPKGVFSGTNHGMQIIPQKGEMVWVEFERGHPEVPIYSNGHFGNGEMPTDDADLLDTNCYWFITPQGHRIKINDTKKYIHISDLSGHYIELNPTGVSIVADKSISLGTLNASAQKAMLGDNTKELLTTIKTFCDTLTKNLLKDSATLTPVAPNTLASLPMLIQNVVDMVTQLDQILSSKNTLD